MLPGMERGIEYRYLKLVSQWGIEKYQFLNLILKLGIEKYQYLEEVSKMAIDTDTLINFDTSFFSA